MIEVRDARPDDADAIASAHVEGWRGGYRGVFSDEFLDGDEFRSSRIAMWRGWTWNDHGRGHLLVSELDGDVVGFSLMGPARDGDRLLDDVGEVYAFYLDPRAWGSGAATPLMARSVDLLAADGHAHAVLWVLRDNPRARRFYAKSGWSPTGRETSWDGPGGAVPEVEYRIGLAAP
ncbi:MAG: GNAT family N-acetyltransferase [Acidimicrobiales bacterium]